MSLLRIPVDSEIICVKGRYRNLIESWRKNHLAFAIRGHVNIFDERLITALPVRNSLLRVPNKPRPPTVDRGRKTFAHVCVTSGVSQEMYAVVRNGDIVVCPSVD